MFTSRVLSFAMSRCGSLWLINAAIYRKAVWLRLFVLPTSSWAKMKGRDRHRPELGACLPPAGRSFRPNSFGTSCGHKAILYVDKGEFPSLTYTFPTNSSAITWSIMYWFRNRPSSRFEPQWTLGNTWNEAYTFVVLLTVRLKEQMTNTSQRNLTSIILWSIAWALTLIASAIFLKGNPAKEWIQAALFIAALTVSLWQGSRLSCRR